VLVASVAIAAAGSTEAQNRYFVGARNLGMGNTGVASTTDALAVHFNPAGMAFNHGWEIQLPLITVDAEVGGSVFDDVDQIVDDFATASLDEIQARLDNGTATREDLATVLDVFLYELQDLEGTEGGGTARGIAGPAVRWRNWGFSASFIGNGGAEGTIDLTSGLSLGSLGFDSIPDEMDACTGDPACLDLAGELIDASGGLLDQNRAEVLVAEGGAELTQNARAQELLIRIVEATAAGGTSLADNESGTTTTTLLGQQYTLSYSHLIYRNQLSVGGSLKLIQGEAQVESTFLAGLQDGEETFEDTFDTSLDGETSSELALDVGFMYRPTQKWSVGLVGSNLNSPEFDLPFDLGTFELEPLVRAGVAYRPFKWFNVAADVDLNEIESAVIRDFGYQYWNLGVEFLAGRWFSGWLGAYENTAANRSDPIYTGGLGFRFGRFQIALSGAVSSGDVNISSGDDEETFPNGAGASITLAWLPKRQ
jgi:hypothetical protein